MPAFYYPSSILEFLRLHTTEVSHCSSSGNVWQNSFEIDRVEILMLAHTSSSAFFFLPVNVYITCYCVCRPDIMQLLCNLLLNAGIEKNLLSLTYLAIVLSP